MGGILCKQFLFFLVFGILLTAILEIVFPPSNIIANLDSELIVEKAMKLGN